MDEKKKLEQQRKHIPTLSENEFKDFIDESLKNRQSGSKRVNIGELTKEAKKMIQEIYEGDIGSNIEITNQDVIHTYKKPEHNLESDDLLHAVDVINSPQNVRLSDKQHNQSDVFEFSKDVNGNIKFLTENHPNKNHILIFNGMRRKKIRDSSDAALKSPPEPTPETKTLPNNNVPHSSPKVNREDEDKYYNGGFVEGKNTIGGDKEMEELLEQILGVMQAQDAKIKALEATINASQEQSAFDAFMERQGGRLSPVSEAMSFIGLGDDPMHEVFDTSQEMSEEDGFEENGFVDSVIENVMERLESIKGIAPAEAVPAIAEAEASLQEAAKQQKHPHACGENLQSGNR